MASFSRDEMNPVQMEVSPDIHICGFCKQQYNNFEVFLAHKQNECQLPPSDISVSSTAAAESVQEFPLEEVLQTCVSKAMKKTVKTQKPASKTLKPVLAQKRRTCSFLGERQLRNALLRANTLPREIWLTLMHNLLLGCTFKTQYGQKDMERHMLTHTGDRPYECELCHKRFSRRDKLNLHSRSHTGEKPHKCKHCAYAAADSSSLKKHLRVHYDERPFKCQICPYASRNSSQLTVHLRSHTGDAPFQCSECGAKFKINSDLKRHTRVHSGEKPYACDLCDYRCAMKANLKSHARLRHGAYACTECDFRCTAKAALRAHSRQHAPAHPLRCTCCPYSCTSKGALKRHERVHSDERPFTCPRCPYASKQRANLLVHMRKCHGEKVVEGRSKGAKRGKSADKSPSPAGSRYRVRLEAPRAFRCNLCDASFVREDSLRSHKRQHNNAEKQLRLQNSVPKQTDKGPEQASLALTNRSVPSYANTQLKIFVAPPLGQDGAFIQAAVDVPDSKPETVLLSSEGQNVILNPVIQQVSLLTPVQHMTPPEGSVEHQTVLLTHMSGSEESPLLQTNGSSQAPIETQSFISSTSSSESSHAFITACSDLDSLHTLIQQGGAEVTVVTKGHTSITTATTASSAFESPLDVPQRPPSEDELRQSGEETPALDEGLVVPDINIEPSSSLLVHNVTLSISEQEQQPPIYQLSPHQIFSDSNPPDRIED
ncbi:zinc finger protein 64 isoform X2 [Neoarius graeffei]|uniref:zinc finger protein 64 isoform X2 n=1 Tax=Neoarius graeffei TaxID=443677 RepID=UPI00298BDFF7|nr:zinc finger protein 64 isoform X2 [Neoarius graeffei]